MKHLRESLIHRLLSTPLIETPVPHLYLSDFLPANLKSSIIEALPDSSTLRMQPGGTPYLLLDRHISLPEAIATLRDDVIFGAIRNAIDILFGRFLAGKVGELVSRYGASNVGTTVDLEQWPHIAVALPGHEVGCHHDSFFYHVIVNGYLGHNDGTPCATTTILDTLGAVEDATVLSYLPILPRITYPETDNGLLIFLNTPEAYHMVCAPIIKPRITYFCASIVSSPLL